MKSLAILFIDDDEIERLKFNRICNQIGFNTNIIEAKNGEEALDILEDYNPNLIILDLNMPKMNGFEFLNILKNKKNLNNIPIVVLSSSENQKDIDKCNEIGIADYYIKPLHYDDYKQKTSEILLKWDIHKLLN